MVVYRREKILPINKGLIDGFQGKEANCLISKQLVIDGCVCQIHPIYDLYAATRDGKIIHIIRQVPNAGNNN